jgi:hypothetical protein
MQKGGDRYRVRQPCEVYICKLEFYASAIITCWTWLKKERHLSG